jgi:thiol-disulfide isomerase/thioredoxin
MRRTLMPIALVVLGALALSFLDSRARVPQPGEPIGEVRAELVGGTVFALPQPPGRVTIVNFWATWCAPCRKEVPLLNEAHAGGVPVVGLSIEPLALADLGNRAAALGIQFPVGLAGSSLSDRLGVQVVPTTFVIRADGRIARHHTGGISKAELAEAIATAQMP